MLADEARAFHEGHQTYLVPAGVSRTRSDADVVADLHAEFNRFYQGQPKPRKEVAHMAILQATLRAFQDAGLDLTTLGRKAS
ncbi:hypothetical protein [Stenotrophomonas maltophilia]|uniref:hypothetical protein n=1 Tax=Stenotrophomonas maltophilia TaxID=40324 RepID=UPI002159719D|nr:hypothetical protein [Stenotrophomonas maltophilia]